MLLIIISKQISLDTGVKPTLQSNKPTSSLDSFHLYHTGCPQIIIILPISIAYRKENSCDIFVGFGLLYCQTHMLKIFWLSFHRCNLTMSFKNRTVLKMVLSPEYRVQIQTYGRKLFDSV